MLPFLLATHSWTLPTAARRITSLGRRRTTASLAMIDLGKFFKTGGATATAGAWDAADCTAPGWEELRSLHDAQATPAQLAFRETLTSSPNAASLATERRFDLPDGQSPRVILYRDQAAWCPYCEKVWLALEEKRVPYSIIKVNMNCYGSKPPAFLAIQPSGGIPVARLDGQTIRESNDILQAIEDAFPERPLIPPQGDPRSARVRPLLTLERQLFSAWFGWLTSSSSHGAQLLNFEALLGEVEAALAEGGGPHFLGAELSLVDCMFAPFLERMAASLPYFKGLPLRANPAYPRLDAWFAAMEARPSYRHIQSDFYTHVHDLPPQVGRCQAVPEARPFAAAIDGDDGAWRLPLPAEDALQPLGGLGLSEAEARVEAAERLMHNAPAVARFAARGTGRSGLPGVGAELSDPNATPDEAAVPAVDAALRHVVHALLAGTDAASARVAAASLPSATVTPTLGYLRDRISVPRDMSWPAARQLRAHLNWIIDAVPAQAA